LFAGDKRRNSEIYCNVDALILKQGRISVVIEVEESGIRPTKICGKFLTSALSTTHIHGTKDAKPVHFADRTLFVQILRIPDDFPPQGSGLTTKWDNLEKSINSALPLRDSRIGEYRLFYGTLAQFHGVKGNALRELVKDFLRR
jgi:hypothetical protein